MSEDIKVGDRFLVEVLVTGVENSDEPRFMCTMPGLAGGAWISACALLAAKRLPRALKVGDRVTRDVGLGVAVIGSIIALHDDLAWVVDGSRSSGLFPLSDLTFAEEAR